ncbi:hypothetical protein [Aquisalinus flavus]|uniref:Uncharacterized protein n=1 Tax=Aquisalinus flavus TaxID=1526572 RepID=A0A8J2V1Z0_9PROT|nr:hypothetical protein [Aquisalinus flavus]MBD0426788.1 hypothetical protein [Aquisalinus flavus]UNE46639.1 hypothetical protein FF099_00485 [Aquisalinus flavus]GGC96014.1 hypothetical protein GCM10011342_00990 [Aquisalinus flavus]
MAQHPDAPAAKTASGHSPQDDTVTPEQSADLHTVTSEDTPPPESPDGSPHPNPERRQTLFSRFSQFIGAFAAHVGCVVAFLVLVFAFGMNWFGAVVLVTLAALPAAFFFHRRKEYLTFLGLQFVAATVVGFAFVVLSGVYVG